MITPRAYSWEEIMEVNALGWKNAGLDVTRYIYDPASHWMRAAKSATGSASSA